MKMTSVMILVSNIPNSFKWLGAIVTGLAAIITAYKFFIRRPNIKLQAELINDGLVLEEGLVTAHPVFHLANHGLRYAEDAYLEVSLPTWNFGEGQKAPSVDVNVSVDQENKKTKEKSDVNFFTALHQYLINSLEDEKEQENNGTDTGELVFEDSVLETRHDNTRYIGAPGEINQIFIDDLVYEGTKFRLFSTEIELERFRNYSLEYEVSCRTYGPRKGSIEFEVGYDEIQIYHNHPKPWWARVQNILTEIPFNTGILEVRLNRTRVEFQQVSFFEVLAFPVAEVGVDRHCSNTVTVRAKATVYLGKKNSENIIGTLKFWAYALNPGDIWETIAPNRKITNQFKTQTPHRGLQQIPLVLSPRTPPYTLNPKNELQIDWSIDYHTTTKGDQSGLEIVDSKLVCNTTGRFERVSVRGTLANHNPRERGLFIIAKFFDKNGYVITTPYKQMTVQAESQSEFRIPARLIGNQESRIEEYEFEIIRSL
jgi:hypothetical protein